MIASQAPATFPTARRSPAAYASPRSAAIAATPRRSGTNPLRTIASTAFRTYPRRAVLGLALFI
ncbi:hypothetical protein, partial [Frankia sp. AgKG'84/4]|uniref:hypothetical protein n=1 Tax=Frankia sp. AgKG'84/4 TaxID=573490 RepID=UPI00202A6581